jgi:hypothetical protein
VVGTIAPGATAIVRPGRREPTVRGADGPDPEALLRQFRAYSEERPENQGEIRLVGWSPKPFGGLKLVPGVDRHRGFSVVVVHLRYGPPPAPDGPSYHKIGVETP